MIEKRSLAKLPPRPENRRALTRYPEGLESYYADHFGLRNRFIRHFRRAKTFLGDSPAEDVTVGKDDWLFLGSVKPGYQKYSDPFGDARHTNRYSDYQLQEAGKRYQALSHWLQERGIRFLFVIAPNKHTIYADMLPDYIRPRYPDSAADQLYTHLQTRTDVTTVDLRGALLSEKGPRPLYYKTDTHWNLLGANIAQRVIMEKVEELFPDAIEAELFSVTESTTPGGDLARQVGWDDFIETSFKADFSDHCQPVRQPAKIKFNDPHSYQCEGAELNVLIFRDSFFTALQPFFARKFAHSTYRWEVMKMPALEAAIRQRKPDLVIEQVVERRLPYLPPIAVPQSD